MIKQQITIQNQRYGDQGVKKYYQKKGLKTNFHQGFLDLNPNYNEARMERAKKLASRWESRLGDALLNKHEEVARDNFNNHIKEGNKLSMGQLKKLKENWKGDYIAVQIQESNDVNAYVDKVYGQIEDN